MAQRPNEIRSTLAVLVALHGVDNRAELAARSGLSPSTVGGHIDRLIQQGILRELGVRPTGGRGRPVYRLGMEESAGVVLVAELGSGGARLAVAGLDGHALTDTHVTIDIAAGPAAVLEHVDQQLRMLLSSTDRPDSRVRALVLTLPGPIDDANGTVVRPTLLPGWDSYPLASEMSARFGCSIELHNDANMMALGEALEMSADDLPMIYLKVGSGIGCGLVLADGTLMHGKDGAAGDIAHIQAPGRNDICGCGNVGCIEAVASTRAVLKRLTGPDDVPQASTKLAQLISNGDAAATRAVRDAADVLGDAAALLVHLYNPATIVIGGQITAASDAIVAGIRARVYRRAQPLATRALVIRPTRLQEKAGLIGSLRRAVEIALAPTNIERA